MSHAYYMISAISDVSKGKISPIVRVESESLWHVKKALDCGAHGVIVPMVL